MKSQKLIMMMLLSAASAFSALAPASAQEVKWRMQSNLGTAEPGYESVRVSFVEALEKMSKGRIKIQLHPVGALFPVQEGLEAVGNGVVEIAMMTWRSALDGDAGVDGRERAEQPLGRLRRRSARGPSAVRPRRKRPVAVGTDAERDQVWAADGAGDGPSGRARRRRARAGGSGS